MSITGGAIASRRSVAEVEQDRIRAGGISIER